MTIIPKTSHRSKQEEIMDNFELQGNELKRTLKDLENINKWLGGNKITIKGVKQLLKGKPKSKTYSIADIGCGNGSVLREIAKWGKSNGYDLKLIGIDANAHSIRVAKQESNDFPEINFLKLNIFSSQFNDLDFDIITCTLTLHHFIDQEIASIMMNFKENSNLGVVINDLHRSKMAWYLFQAFCFVFIDNEIARKDGLVSILRAFKKKDLNIYASNIPMAQHTISWEWAFRYLWVIRNKKII